MTRTTGTIIAAVTPAMKTAMKTATEAATVRVTAVHTGINTAKTGIKESIGTPKPLTEAATDILRAATISGLQKVTARLKPTLTRRVIPRRRTSPPKRSIRAS